jgi:hypothetical protein
MKNGKLKEDKKIITITLMMIKEFQRSYSNHQMTTWISTLVAMYYQLLINQYFNFQAIVIKIVVF